MLTTSPAKKQCESAITNGGFLPILIRAIPNTQEMMMSEPKLTDWFVNGEKPVRPGVYNVSCRRKRQTGKWYAKWTGRRWLKFSDSADAAAWETRQSVLMTAWGGSWRGLAHPPKAKP